MARRKCFDTKWTLVLLLVVVCPYVYSRPQESTSVKTDVSTENSIRYLIRNKNFSLSTLPKVISFVNITKNKNNNNIEENLEHKILHNTSNSRGKVKRIDRSLTRYKNSNNRISTNLEPKVKIPQVSLNDKPKPAIRKVITKWKDKTNYEDLTFNYDTTTSDEIEPTIVIQTEFNTDISKESTSNKQYYSPQTYGNYYRPNIQPVQNTQPIQNVQPSYSQGQVYSDAIQIVDYHTPRPTYILTNQPSPTPVITNVGYPSQWQAPQIYQKPTTQKPVFVTKPLNYNYPNSIHNYPGNFEVSTFPPTSAYTDRIVIRPQEYAGPDECPTIYLTLNNTFQGEGKEACPDLNIAVNTNVINKNVVVESEEEDDGDSLFQNPFGIPIDDSSTPDDTAENEYSEEQEENQGESASVEETEFSNYQAGGNLVDESEEPISSAPSHHLSSLSKPGRPDKDDDDPFSFSSLVNFFKPALKALGWLVSVNPFAIGLFPLFLTPIAFLFAGSGLASLFSPWFLPLGREAPKVVHVFRPYWHWDDKIKTWHLHSFPDNRKWTESRSSKEDKESTFKPTLFFKLKELMKMTTKVLKEREKSLKENERKRSKREIWTLRVK